MVLRSGIRAALVVCWFASVLPGQQDRIVAPIDAHVSIVIRGSVPRQAQPQFDRGAVEPDFRLGNITLMLRPPAAASSRLSNNY